MKKTLMISAILSWFNLITGSILVLSGLAATVFSPDIISILTSVVLTGSIVLHSYAALQLRKSILYPQKPLSRHTPVGIRFIGFMALFFGVWNLSNSIITIQHAEQLAQQIKLPAQYKDMRFNLTAVLRGAGIFSVIISVSIIINVLLNFRLFRWYFIDTGNEVK